MGEQGRGFKAARQQHDMPSRLGYAQAATESLGGTAARKLARRQSRLLSSRSSFGQPFAPLVAVGTSVTCVCVCRSCGARAQGVRSEPVPSRRAVVELLLSESF